MESDLVVRLFAVSLFSAFILCLRFSATKSNRGPNDAVRADVLRLYCTNRAAHHGAIGFWVEIMRKWMGNSLELEKC